MNCPRCGVTLNDNHNFCPNCGLALKIENPSVETVRISQSQDKNAGANDVSRMLGTKWLKFWNYFCLPVGGVFSLIFGFGSLGVIPALGIILIADSIFRFAVAYGLHSRKRWAWQANWFLIIIHYILGSIPIIPILNGRSNEEMFALFLIMALFFGLIWLWPNIVYWEKRKVLFT